MSKRLDGASIFTGINSGLTNAFAQLNGQYSDGVTLENLNKALTNSNYLTNSGTNGTFASYMTNNFNAIDSNTDGKISAEEIQNLMSQMATQGLTREQIITLAGSNGLSSSLQETVLNHFNQIDKNKDGKVTNQEIQAYGVESDLEKQKSADRNRIVSNMSMFYDVGSVSDSSLLDYRYLSEDNS
jgi:Ca2+-binding EF-hand superfamily protein